MYLTYEDLTVRNAVADDAPLLASWWNDGRVMAHAGFPRGLGESEEMIVEMLRHDSDVTYRRMILLISGTPIGEMSCRNLGDDIAEIGIKICVEQAQNLGYGKKFLSMLITSLFNDMGYKKIILDTNLKNERARYVYEKLGFEKVGERINAWLDQNGEPQSIIDYELTQKHFNSFIA